MSAVVTYSNQGNLALITVNNPPVNALSQAVRVGLKDAVMEGCVDRAVAAMVILCEGKTFIAGADVREFNRPPEPPHLPDLIQAIEDSPKPVIAAIHGTALGGGFEVALGCHFRVAARSAKVGLPEVKLGLIPGAGGTQRLPRLIGVEPALKLITDGNPISAEKAKALGVIDEIIEEDLAAGALAFAQRIVSAQRPLRKASALTARLDSPGLFEEFERNIARKQRGFIAPGYCAKAVRAAVELPFAEGMKRERALFLELRASPQAAAQRHVFFGEREIAKVPGLPEDTPIRNISSVAVVGAGTMGGGIAMCFANAGVPVKLLEAQQDALDRGLAAIQKNYAASVAKASLAQGEMDRRLALITPSLTYDDLGDTDLIIEAVFEDLAVKKAVFEKLDAVAKPGAILATNTSYLDVSAIAQFTSRPQDVVGMHFFSPANVMKLLENVRAEKTAPDVLATVMSVGKRIGKVAVLVGGAEGFVGNRMLAQRTREAYFLLEEGALPQQVDKALYDFGFPMGPFAVGDLAGLDVGWRNRKSRLDKLTPRERACNILDKICEQGRFGQKTGAGFYRYEGGRAPVPDPEVDNLIVEHSKQVGIERRTISDEEIIERCLYAMINEGAKILQEGVAARPVDIDMVWIHGYGFPVYRGGPMFYADQVGLKAIYDTILKYRDRFGPDFWTPAPLLAELAESSKGFYSR
jgi:3-hydroxyacyl-CoA dehydrogenase